ncbi:MAG: polysaccharide deacetylase family protein [Clostridia bacterium]|nr:polysaccharide deacetylase family protein [Clostridia bacterium]
MGFFKQKTNIIFLFVIFLLVAVLSGISYFAYEKHNDYVAVSASLSDNSTALEEAQKKIDELTAKIAEYDEGVIKSEQEKAELNSQLQAALQEKAKLEQENSNLKSEIEQLKTEKRREELQKAIALKNVNQADTAEGGICYLTFDDGPSDNTLKILDILDAYGIKATFFVVGTSKQEYMPQIVSRGHAIGLHSTTHKYDVIYKDINSYLADIQQISDIVYNTTGVRSNIIRFPGGSSNMVSAGYCKGIMTDLTVRMPSLGYSYYDWNVSSGDANAARVPAQTIVNNVLNGAKGKSSICVLMHDNGGKTTTVEALPAIIEGLDAMGFRFAPLTAEVFGFHQKVNN